MLSLWRRVAPRTPGRVLAIGSVVSTALYGACFLPARAQDTVYVGGSGQPSVEVNLDVLNDLQGGGGGRQLLEPGEKPLYLRRSTPPRILGRDIVRVPAPPAGAAKRTAKSLAPTRRLPGGQTPSLVTTQPFQPAPAPQALAPALAPAQAPIAAPTRAQLPSRTVRRAAPAPLRPLPSMAQPLPSKKDQKRLTELAALRDENLISDADYAAKRAKIIGHAAPTPPLPGKSATGTPPLNRATPARPAGVQKRLDELAALRRDDLITADDYVAKRKIILGRPGSITRPPAATAPVSTAPVPPPPRTLTKPKPVASASASPASLPAPKTTSPREQETKVAALPAPAPAGGAPQLRLDFESTVSSLTPSQTDQIKSLASRLQNSKARLQVRAYAGATGEDKGSARRASLKRALAVRSRLIEGGIRSTRIDVRALGAAGGDGPADRVDIYTVTR